MLSRKKYSFKTIAPVKSKLITASSAQAEAFFRVGVGVSYYYCGSTVCFTCGNTAKRDYTKNQLFYTEGLTREARHEQGDLQHLNLAASLPSRGGGMLMQVHHLVFVLIEF